MLSGTCGPLAVIPKVIVEMQSELCNLSESQILVVFDLVYCSNRICIRKCTHGYRTKCVFIRCLFRENLLWVNWYRLYKSRKVSKKKILTLLFRFLIRFCRTKNLIYFQYLISFFSSYFTETDFFLCRRNPYTSCPGDWQKKMFQSLKIITSIVKCGQICFRTLKIMKYIVAKYRSSGQICFFALLVQKKF